MRTDPLLVFAAVKKTAPSSREATSPKVPDQCFFCFVATWGNGPEAFDACCATNEVAQFFVCCATYVLSVGLLFFNAELFFFRPCHFRRLVRNFSFLRLFRRLKFETTSSGVRVGIRVGVRLTRCAGVSVCWCLGVFFLFTLVCLCLPAGLPALGACLPWVPARP